MVLTCACLQLGLGAGRQVADQDLLHDDHLRYHRYDITRGRLVLLVLVPMSGAARFNIRSFMASLADVRCYPAHAEPLAAVPEELPDDLVTCKGFVDLIPDRHLSPLLSSRRQSSRTARRSESPVGGIRGAEAHGFIDQVS